MTWLKYHIRQDIKISVLICVQSNILPTIHKKSSNNCCGNAKWLRRVFDNEWHLTLYSVIIVLFDITCYFDWSVAWCVSPYGKSPLTITSVSMGTLNLYGVMVHIPEHVGVLTVMALWHIPLIKYKRVGHTLIKYKRVGHRLVPIHPQANT